jgi:hypothetical protein
MRSGLLLSIFLLALVGCDRLSIPIARDAGVDSLASQWERVNAGSMNFNAVTGSAPDNVFIVGDEGTILHWNGTALVREESGTTANLRGVAVADKTLAFAVGEQGILLRRHDEVWTLEAPLTTAVLNAVCFRGDYAVAVGEQGTVLVQSQGTWTLVPNARNDNYYAVADTAAGVVAVGSLGIVIQPNLEQRTVPDPPPRVTNAYSKTLSGIARYASGAYIVGVDGAVFYWESGVGTRMDLMKGPEGWDVPLTPRKFLRAVSAIGETAWIIGHEGLVYSMEPSSSPDRFRNFTPWATPDDRWLMGVYAAAVDDLWVVGRSGLILRGPPGVRGVAKDGGAP